MKQLNIILNENENVNGVEPIKLDQMYNYSYKRLKYELIKELIILITCMCLSIGLCVFILWYYGTSDLAIVSPVTLIVLFGMIYI